MTGLWGSLALALILAGAALTVVAPRRTGPLAEPVASPSAAMAVSDTAVLDAISDPVLIAAGDQVIAANVAARSLLGSHVLGGHVRLAIRDPAAAEYLAGPVSMAPIELARLGDRDSVWELSQRPLDGGRRLIRLTDRTQRHVLDRARTDFVANASHELRTPLAAILGFVETLTDDVAGSDAAVRKRFLGVIDAEARRMQRLVDDLMSLSRIEADKHQRPTAAVDLGAIVRLAADELREPDGRKRSNVDLDVEPQGPFVLGDRAQLLQVVTNLLDNARKYGRPNGRIVVAIAKSAADRVTLTVTDQGEGIEQEHLPRLTERFYRVDPGRSRAGGGTGLGLSIVKHIIERHRGRLEIASTPGVGTTVTITLPASA